MNGSQPAPHIISVAPQLAPYREQVIASRVTGLEFLCFGPDAIHSRLGIAERGDVLIVMTLIRVLLASYGGPDETLARARSNTKETLGFLSSAFDLADSNDGKHS